MQDIGRLGEAANVDDLHEILKPPAIHAKASRTMPGDAWRNQALRRALSISVACIKAERTHLGHRDAELPAGCEARRRRDAARRLRLHSSVSAEPCAAPGQFRQRY